MQKKILAMIWKLVGPIILLFTQKSSVRIPILCYHSINDVPDSHADPVPVDVFRCHVKHLKEHHTVISLKYFLKILDGKVECPDRPVVITFDDGYKDNYTNAFPVLKASKAPATFFVVTDFINNNIDLIGLPEWGPMEWDELVEMSNDPLMDIGAHTHSHRLLATLEDEEAVEEIKLSKQTIEDKLNTQITLFAYPNGQGKDISPAAKKYVENSGFICACSTFWNTRNNKAQKFILNRIMVSGSDTTPILINRINGDYDYIYFIHKLKAFINVCKGGKGIWR